MGLILDSSVVIAAERRGNTITGFLRYVASMIGEERVALSAVGFTELVHSIYRTQMPAVRKQREDFLAQLLLDLEVVPYTKETAFLAGRIDGEQRARGVTIPMIDLLIGATALEYGYSVATVNLRHFRLIPGLTVIAF